MGSGPSSNSVLGKSSTAKQVVDHFSGGNANFLKGKIAVVTGGNSGIGLETVKALSSAGCRVILGSRSVEAGRKAIEDEVKCPGSGQYIVADASNIVVAELNLESLPSIKSFAEVVQKEPRVDYLVLNAGIMAVPSLEYTQYGWEKQIATNHFGHFYLTSLVLDKLKAQSHPSRVVSVSSVAHTMGKVVPSDLHYKNGPRGRSYSAWEAYGQSKAANILFTKELADRLKDSNVRALCLHPGVINTNLQRYMSAFTTFLVRILITDKSIPQGASTSVYACLNPEFESKELSGCYLSDCAIAKPNEHCTDASGALRKELWKVTEEQIQAALSSSR